MGVPIPEIKRAKAVRLRVERQLSAPEIARRVGISNQTAYKILKRHPWTGRTARRAEWTRGEVEALLRLWPVGAEAEIKAAIPRRKWASIGRKASDLGVSRPTSAYRRDGAKAHPVIAKLEKIRRAEKIDRSVVSKRSKIHVNSLCLWSLGRRMPKLDAVSRWAEAMGFEITVRRKA